MARESCVPYAGVVRDTPEEMVFRKIPINVNKDIYDATVVAAFGGVWIGHANHGVEPVHPFWIFVPSACLFLLQGSLLSALTLDLDLSVDFVKTEMPGDRILIWIKSAVYFLVLLQLFSSIMGTLHLLVFILTPSTWNLEKVKRPDPRNMHSCFAVAYRTGLVLPWAVLSLLCKLTIEYAVCVTSLSVILQAENVVSALFNSVAIIWIADLDILLWDAISTVAVLDRKAFEHFRFECCVKHLKKKTVTWVRLTNILTNLGMLFMYWRQCCMVQMALDSNNLPAARDVCSAWRWFEGPEAVPFAKTVLNYLFPVIGDVLEIRADPLQGGFCDASYYPMSFADMLAESASHPGVVFLMVGLAMFFFSPHLSTFISKRFGKNKLDLIDEQASLKDDDDVTDGVGIYPNILKLRESIYTLEETFSDHKRDLHSHKEYHVDAITQLEQQMEQKLLSLANSIDSALRSIPGHGHQAASTIQQLRPQVAGLKDMNLNAGWNMQASTAPLLERNNPLPITASFMGSGVMRQYPNYASGMQFIKAQDFSPKACTPKRFPSTSSLPSFIQGCNG